MSDQPIELKTQESAKVLAELAQFQTQGMGGISKVFYTITDAYEKKIKSLLAENERLQAKCEKEGLSTGKNRAQRRREQKKAIKK